MDTDHDGQEVCEHSALEVLTKTQGQTNTCAKTNGKKYHDTFHDGWEFRRHYASDSGPQRSLTDKDTERQRQK